MPDLSLTSGEYWGTAAPVHPLRDPNRKYVGYGELAKGTSAPVFAGGVREHFLLQDESLSIGLDQLMSPYGPGFYKHPLPARASWALVYPFSSGTDNPDQEATVSELQALLDEPLTGVAAYALQKDTFLTPQLIGLAKEIRRVLPDGLIWLAYEPDEEGTIWVMYVLLTGDSLYEDLSRLDSVYYDYLPKQDPQFNQKVTVVPL